MLASNTPTGARRPRRAANLARQLTKVRRDGTISYLRPDGKTQVSLRYEGRKAVLTFCSWTSSTPVHRIPSVPSQKARDFSMLLTAIPIWSTTVGFILCFLPQSYKS